MGGRGVERVIQEGTDLVVALVVYATFLQLSQLILVPKLHMPAKVMSNAYSAHDIIKLLLHRCIV